MQDKQRIQFVCRGRKIEVMPGGVISLIYHPTDPGNIVPEDLRVISEELKKRKVSIKVLYLDSNNIGSQGLKYILSAPFQNLKSLSLNKNKIGKEGIKFLAKNPLKNLVGFFCDENNIGVEAAIYFSNSFKKLLNLSLENNSVGSKGVIYIRSGPLQNLIILNLKANKISSEGVKQLVKINMDKLTYLDLSRNKIGSMGVMHLSNVSLKIINLNLGNKFYAEGLKVLGITSFTNVEKFIVGPGGYFEMVSRLKSFGFTYKYGTQYVQYV